MTQENESSVCGHPECDAACDDDNYCFGCKEYICDEHDLNMNMPMGDHLVVEHWEEEDDEGW